jgi:glycosyltransferase involved in cell wall biosynthesis
MDGERRPTVLLTADTIGGVWTYAAELARALAARGIDVHLATMGAPVRADQRQQVAGRRGITLHASDWKLEWMPDGDDAVDLAGAWLLGLERQLRPDLVHLNQFSFGALPFRAPTLLVAHSCVLSWWQAVHGYDAPADWDRYRQRVAAGLAGADLVAAPTRAMLDTLAGNHGVRIAGRVLPNGRSPALFRPGGKQPVVLSAGRFWDEAKNLAALDAAAEGLPWPVRVAGSCVHPGGRLVLPRHARPLGQLDQDGLATQLGAAAIYALPARYEPFGLSVLEAALCGCALVLGDIASLRETWGGAALYVPPDDSAALHATLLRLIDQPDERARLGAAARSRALQFSPGRMADACLAAYASLAPAFHARREEVLPCA